MKFFASSNELPVADSHRALSPKSSTSWRGSGTEKVYLHFICCNRTILVSPQESHEVSMLLAYLKLIEHAFVKAVLDESTDIVRLYLRHDRTLATSMIYVTLTINFCRLIEISLSSYQSLQRTCCSTQQYMAASFQS